MTSSANATVRSVGLPARITSEIAKNTSETTISVAWTVARIRAVPSVSV